MERGKCRRSDTPNETAKIYLLAGVGAWITGDFVLRGGLLEGSLCDEADNEGTADVARFWS